jgi:hypothetical protein
MKLLQQLSKWTGHKPTGQTAPMSAASIVPPALNRPEPSDPQADFGALVATARFVAAPLKPAVDPLPCEQQNLYSARERVAMAKWPMLDLAFMRTTYHDSKAKHKLPVYAAQSIAMPGVFTDLYRMDLPLWKICHRWDNKQVLMNPALKEKRPVIELGITGSTRVIEFKFRFQGTIPDAVRLIAREAAAEFDDMYLICDAKGQWQQEIRPNPDPLLVGVLWVNNQPRAFLLAKFDMTPAEQWVADEMAVNPEVAQ